MKLLSHVWLFATPWTVTYQAPLSMGFYRQEYWNGCHCLLWGIDSLRQNVRDFLVWLFRKTRLWGALPHQCNSGGTLSWKTRGHQQPSLWAHPPTAFSISVSTVAPPPTPPGQGEGAEMEAATVWLPHMRHTGAEIPRPHHWQNPGDTKVRTHKQARSV